MQRFVRAQRSARVAEITTVNLSRKRRDLLDKLEGVEQKLTKRVEMSNHLRNQANLRARLAEYKVERLKINTESVREKLVRER